jgi:hypothetical protein
VQLHLHAVMRFVGMHAVQQLQVAQAAAETHTGIHHGATPLMLCCGWQRDAFNGVALHCCRSLQAEHMLLSTHQ